MAISVEHQTWEKVATRFSAATTLFSTGEVQNTDYTYIDMDGNGQNDTIGTEAETTLITSPRSQVATVAMGLGIKPAEKVSVDIAIKANIFDIDAGAGTADMISRASLKYSF